MPAPAATPLISMASLHHRFHLRPNQISRKTIQELSRSSPDSRCQVSYGGEVELLDFNKWADLSVGWWKVATVFWQGFRSFVGGSWLSQEKWESTDATSIISTDFSCRNHFPHLRRTPSNTGETLDETSWFHPVGVEGAHGSSLAMESSPRILPKSVRKMRYRRHQKEDSLNGKYILLSIFEKSAAEDSRLLITTIRILCRKSRAKEDGRSLSGMRIVIDGGGRPRRKIRCDRHITIKLYALRNATVAFL